MNNDSFIHRPECKDQPEDMSCICSELEQQEYDEMVDLQIMQARKK